MRQKEESISFRLMLFVPMSETSDGKENLYTKVSPGRYTKLDAAIMRKFGSGHFLSESVKR